MELDKMSVLQAAGKTPIQIAAWLAAQRHRKGIVPPNLTAVRRALHGQSTEGASQKPAAARGR